MPTAAPSALPVGAHDHYLRRYAAELDRDGTQTPSARPQADIPRITVGNDGRYTVNLVKFCRPPQQLKRRGRPHRRFPVSAGRDGIAITLGTSASPSKTTLPRPARPPRSSRSAPTDTNPLIVPDTLRQHGVPLGTTDANRLKPHALRPCSLRQLRQLGEVRIVGWSPQRRATARGTGWLDG